MKSITAAGIIAAAARESVPDACVDELILADGGEGTLETFGRHFGSVRDTHNVSGPLGGVVSADLSFLDQTTALIESAQAIGLSLVAPGQANPFTASTYGVGELIQYASRRGATRIIVSMGDSATMDMGVGMLHCLGVKFYSAGGAELRPALHNLHEIAAFDDSGLDGLRDRATFVGLVDTNDYLCGEIGQVQLYGRQKGLHESDIPRVESAFQHFAAVVERRLGVDLTRVIRATGSGGLAAALHAFFGAALFNTLDYLAERLPLDDLIPRADVTITGEGCLDHQTRLGKVPHFVAARSSHRCIAIVGSYTDRGLRDMQEACVDFSIFPMNPARSLHGPHAALRQIVRSACSLLRLR